ncbi:GNAT family N-acetyltransferase [Micromonospora sp. WMMC415]|nr:GNAT family N-acetyltransferase [Micromonospora sp. WMMC415]
MAAPASSPSPRMSVGLVEDDAMSAESVEALARTERLVLRKVRAHDLPVLGRMWQDPVMRRYLGGPVSDEVAAERRAGDPTGGLMVTRSSGEIVGWCHLGRYRTGDLELSYIFLPEWWGRGYAREGCTAAIGLAFDRFPDASRLVAVTQEANRRSVCLLEALGMVRVDTFEEFGARQVMYAIDRQRAASGAGADRRHLDAEASRDGEK